MTEIIIATSKSEAHLLSAKLIWECLSYTVSYDQSGSYWEFAVKHPLNA